MVARRRQRAVAGRGAAMLMILAVVAQQAGAYPPFFTTSHAESCLHHPSKPLGGHGASTPDSETVIEVVPASSSVKATPAKRLCPGAQYKLRVKFPAPRLALITISSGALVGGDAKCPNRFASPTRAPAAAIEEHMVVPCSSAGTGVQFKVTSAQSSSGAFKFATATLPVAAARDAACAGVSSCAMPADIASGAAPVPVQASKFDASGADGSEDALADSATRVLQPPEYALRPILKTNKTLWQFLHSVLMLAAFGLLLPMGVLLARHKWMFGRNPSTGKVMGSWVPLHAVTQLLAVLAAAGGFVIAILAFGWKSVPGVPLYLPHKWIGVGVMGMALLQLLAAPIRPKHGTRAHGFWSVLHGTWGRLLVLAGAGNCVVGALLLHDYKEGPYLYWLLPTCALIGFMGLLAVVLEAFKVQMQRTYRYNHRTREMLPVLDGRKHSRRRGLHSDSGASSSSGSGRSTPDAAASSKLYPPVQHYEGGSAYQPQGS